VEGGERWTAEKGGAKGDIGTHKRKRIRDWRYCVVPAPGSIRRRSSMIALPAFFEREKYDGEEACET